MVKHRPLQKELQAFLEAIPNLPDASVPAGKSEDDNIELRIGDGYYGWIEHAPFDAIIVTAASSHIPPPLVIASLFETSTLSNVRFSRFRIPPPKSASPFLTVKWLISTCECVATPSSM